MNSDSLFDTPFVKENKGLISLFVTISLAFLTIYFLYNRLQTHSTHNRSTVQVQQPKIVKKRLTIDANDILLSDPRNIDISGFYTILDRLSKFFDIYLIIIIDENEDQNAIIEKLADLYRDDIVKKHVNIINIENTFLE
jgi:hypothetical protein